MNPNKSVTKPGTKSSKPDIAIISPPIIFSIGALPDKISLLIFNIVDNPCNLTKYTPIIAVTKIRRIVLKVPRKLPNWIKVAISITGRMTNIVKNI